MKQNSVLDSFCPDGLKEMLPLDSVLGLSGATRHWWAGLFSQPHQVIGIEGPQEANCIS